QEKPLVNQGGLSASRSVVADYPSAVFTAWMRAAGPSAASTEKSACGSGFSPGLRIDNSGALQLDRRAASNSDLSVCGIECPITIRLNAGYWLHHSIASFLPKAEVRRDGFGQVKLSRTNHAEDYSG